MNPTRLFAIALALVIAGSLFAQFYQYNRFVSAGPRFTAYDGQELCLRIEALERAHGLDPKPCHYGR